MKPFQAFISHASAAPEEKELARQIAQLILMNGEAVWFDENQINLGDDLYETLDRGIAQSECFILLWSKHAEASENVKKEYEHALKLSNDYQYPRILVVKLDRTETPKRLDKYVWLNWEYDNLSVSFMRIFGFINDSNLTNIQSRISAMNPWINYDKSRHNVLEMRLNAMTLTVSVLRSILYKFIGESDESELRDTLKKLVDTEIFRQFRLVKFNPIFPLDDGKYELIFNNRMRIAPNIKFKYLPKNLTLRIINANEVSATFAFMNSSGFIHQGIVPFSFQIELDAEL